MYDDQNQPAARFGTSRARSNSQVRATPPSWLQAIQIDLNRSNISMETHEAPRRAPVKFDFPILMQAFCVCKYSNNIPGFLRVSWQSWHFVSLSFFFPSSEWWLHLIVPVLVCRKHFAFWIATFIADPYCVSWLVVSMYLRISDQVESCPQKEKNIKTLL